MAKKHIDPDGLRYIVLRELVTEYQENPNEVVFAKLLKRTDLLILHTLVKLVSWRRDLQRVPIRDLYHIGIVGLGRAVKTARDTETGAIIAARIIAYVKEEIRLTYPNGVYRKWDRELLKDDSIKLAIVYESQLQEADTTAKDVELLFFKERIDELVRKSVIKQRTVDIVYDYVNGHTLLYLKEKYKTNYEQLRRSINTGLHVLRQNLKEYDTNYE